MLSLSLNVNAARCSLLAVAVAVSAAVDVGHERENESTITRAEASCQGERIGVVVQGGRWARVGRKSWMEPSSVDVSVCDYLCVCVSRGCHDDEHARACFTMLRSPRWVDNNIATALLCSVLCTASLPFCVLFFFFVMADFKCDKWPSRAKPSRAKSEAEAVSRSLR